MSEGILLVNKSAGMTSHDVVWQIRKLYGTKQVGHTGTLDPMATGLLPVLIGRAVKASEYATDHDKRYLATLRLGIETDTEDITGTVLRRAETLPRADEVVAAALSFRGPLRQVPPMYSALKRGGEKLCDLARRGIEVEREARSITVYDLSCEVIDEAEGLYALSIFCSKGTYVRTLCADIGRALGCGGAMASLQRVGVGAFSLENAHTIEELTSLSPAEREALLAPTESLFSDLPLLRLPPFFARLAQAGCEIYLQKLGLSLPLGQRVRLYDDSFFSLGEVRHYDGGDAIKPIKKFRLE